MTKDQSRRDKHDVDCFSLSLRFPPVTEFGMVILPTQGLVSLGWPSLPFSNEVMKIQESRAGRTVRCRCKFRYMSYFTMASCCFCAAYSFVVYISDLSKCWHNTHYTDFHGVGLKCGRDCGPSSVPEVIWCKLQITENFIVNCVTNFSCNLNYIFWLIKSNHFTSGAAYCQDSSSNCKINTNY